MGYLRALLQDRKVASIARTSHSTIQRLLAPLYLAGSKTIIEYGAGDGVITRALLARMTEDSKLIAFEPNPHLYERLHIQDPRLRVIQDGCEHVEAYVDEQVDHIISGVPLRLFSDVMRHSIITQAHRLLLPGGHLALYQTSAGARPYLESLFPQVQVQRSWKNLPPLVLLHARK